MNFITKKSIDRRAFLHGVGATVALPLLDAMVPASTALAKTAANPVRRVGYVFMPMGCDMTRWTPPERSSEAVPGRSVAGSFLPLTSSS